ncbi:uncharacterized protein LOC118458572 [Anopheles albimanus]|uniref:uncharacterized protein LOC118458572 n=1 Tax=Anopheles albimanus TaxID=7167 RepID=UPI00164127FA|nr:uncharacterized protein LOC118458572 [Anopheles albimanus]XP_035777234.1 uncharacterized protein LOC118458572 [Anopheles albimanus]XP_035777323.1 uncharacterized protein LOC118458572 [Anopheles albimanus]XP_035777405.1 uncharacterized protein LOC118458572 [Anopheles albimanus]XP_035777495.1 uncharacterized protein LOC118458572 [Anopheles albimanus]
MASLENHAQAAWCIAIVHQSQFVKPIDSDQAMLKINPKRPGFKQTMQELQMYLALPDGPRQSFAFGTTSSHLAATEIAPPIASPLVPVAPVRSAPGRGRPMKRWQSPSVSSNLRAAKKKTTNGPLVHVDDNSIAPLAANRFEESVHSQNQTSFVNNNTITDTATPSPLGSSTPFVCHERSKTSECSRDQQLRAEIEELKRRCAEAKSKRWRSACEKEALLECCWTTAYCSQDCRQRHWAEHRSTHSQLATAREDLPLALL